MKIYTTCSTGINIALKYYNQVNTKMRWIYDKSALLNQAKKWSKCIPWIKPYYAVKSNPLSYILEDLMEYNTSLRFKNLHNTIKPQQIGLDVASIKETMSALKYTPIENTIYTNPHTILYEIPHHIQIPFQIKVIDSICELELLNTYSIKCPILVRVNSSTYINKANINFNSKFGATIEEAYEIIQLAHKYNYEVKGVSFHIGSGGEYSRKEVFQLTYYKNAQPLLNYIQHIYNKKANSLILNFGGGFLYNTDLTDALGWSEQLPYTMIAEPGRYFSEPSHHLAIQVIAITGRGLFLDNGVYHELNCFHRDHWKMPLLTHCIEHNTINKVVNYNSSTLFGPTCDSYDTLGLQKIPDDIKVGDWILLPNMGAYTNAGAIEFNGIKCASSYTR
jgi:ornithine decarboxylase